MSEPVKKKRGRKPKPKPDIIVPKVKKKRGRKPKPKPDIIVPKVKKKRGRKKKCDIDALHKITGYSKIGESIDIVDNKINFSECNENFDKDLPSQKISFGNLSIIVQNAKKEDPKEIQRKLHDKSNVISTIQTEKKQVCSLNFSDSEEESDEEEIVVHKKIKKFNKNINKNINFIGIMKHYDSINSPGKNIPNKTDLWCWYCSHSFNTQPLFLPTNFYKDRYKVCGNFCSWGCVKAYSSRRYQGKYNILIQKYFKDLTGESFLIKSNPDISILKVFGGNMTIEEFRNIQREKFYIIMKPNIVYTKNTIVELESY